jgi:hypothetical protein
MCGEWSMCPECLSTQRLSKAAIMLGHVSHVISMRIHNDVSICLLEAKENVHHLDLPLYNEARLREDICRRMGGFDNCIGILRDVDRCQKIVRRIFCVG